MMSVCAQTHKGSVYSMKRNCSGELQCYTKSKNDTFYHDLRLYFCFSFQTNVSYVVILNAHIVLSSEYITLPLYFWLYSTHEPYWWMFRSVE